MANLSPLDVRNVAFRKPPLGKRGYDEEEVDAFLTEVEHTIESMRSEIASLRHHPQGPVDYGNPDAARYGTSGAADAAVLAELDQIKVRLARIEAAVTTRDQRPPSDPVFGQSRRF